MQQATFGAGCFWGVEAAFQKIKGVLTTKVGYMGGHVKNPTYKEVCTDKTGHAEVVHLTYDPNKISYEQLLDVFWDIHDPTQLNKQGPDRGTQYRSIVFYHDEAQKKMVEQSKQKQQTSGNFNKKIVTEIVPAQEFYPAEEYHQKYFEKQGRFCCS